MISLKCYVTHGQKNEAMNNSVAAYAPKTKNFSGTISLKTGVDIAAGVLSLGYFQFWKQVFQELHIEMDDEFATTLLTHDKKKEAKNERQESFGAKTKQRKVYNEKFGKAHAEQMNNVKTDKTYGARVALKTAMKKAQKTLTAASRNPKGTPKELLRCRYHHPIYCTVL